MAQPKLEVVPKEHEFFIVCKETKKLFFVGGIKECYMWIQLFEAGYIIPDFPCPVLDEI